MKLTIEINDYTTSMERVAGKCAYNVYCGIGASSADPYRGKVATDEALFDLVPFGQAAEVVRLSELGKKIKELVMEYYSTRSAADFNLLANAWNEHSVM